MNMIKSGFKVNTNRRKSITVLSDPDKAGWFQGRTLGGKVIYLSLADVTKAWKE